MTEVLLSGSDFTLTTLGDTEGGPRRGVMLPGVFYKGLSGIQGAHTEAEGQERKNQEGRCYLATVQVRGGVGSDRSSPQVPPHPSDHPAFPFSALPLPPWSVPAPPKLTRCFGGHKMPLLELGMLISCNYSNLMEETQPLPLEMFSLMREGK